ncbi:MAG: FxsA family protein [Gammaproteobacteria bacterium]|nr:FxsA family protein [Gammaproteobacteria bacterium]MDH5802984.1 FxsA family protein [Gammaproteobacteria bacterium]
MKWFVLLLLLGIVEVVLVAQLHEMMGMTNLVILYIATTLVGTIILLLRLPEFKRSWKGMRNNKSSLKKLNKTGRNISQEEIQQIKPFLFITVYLPALILIAIPGIVTDAVGIVILVPVVSNWLVGRGR